MISAALCNPEKDAALLEQEIRNEAAMRTDERVTIKKLLNRRLFEEFLKEKSLVDFVCVDVTAKQGIESAELVRENYPDTALVLVADLSMSPVTYMKPSIMASALMLKPLRGELVRQTLDQLFEFYLEKIVEDVFVIETKEEKQRLPYSAIFYFEARAKKVYACTVDCEYGFYGTMDQLEAQLSEDFVRCHRSYIINKKYISRVMLSKGCVLLQEEIEIPLSRSYKGVLKENAEGK